MDKLLLTKCLRCRGAVIYDKFYGPHEQFWGWKAQDSVEEEILNKLEQGSKIPKRFA